MRVIPLSSLDQFAAVNLNADPGAVGGPKLVPSCAQIVIGWQLADGKTGHNVLYGRYSNVSVVTAATAQAIKTALLTGSPWTNLVAFFAPGTGFLTVTVRDVNTRDQPIFSSNSTLSPGTSAGSALPSEVAAVLTLTTALAGKSGRGRQYVPCWATNALGAGDTIAPAAVTALGVWGELVRTTINANGFQHVLGLPHRNAYTSPSTGTVHPDRPATSVNIVASVVKDNHWDTQRRRGLR